MSLNQLVRLPLSSNGRTRREDSLFRHFLFSTSRTLKPCQQKLKLLVVVEPKSKKEMAARQYQRQAPLDDGNPKFVIVIRTANDEKEMQKMAMKQFRVLRSATEFKYGFKLVKNYNQRAALAANDVIELP